MWLGMSLALRSEQPSMKKAGGFVCALKVLFMLQLYHTLSLLLPHFTTSASFAWEGSV